MGMLARKGYSGGLAAAVVREALDAGRSPTPASCEDERSRRRRRSIALLRER